MSWRIKFYFSGSSYLWYDKSITYALQGTKKKKICDTISTGIPAYELCL